MSGVPILVTGSHKSGTTWIGEMLAQSRQVGYISEPFNPDRRPGISALALPTWFTYVPQDRRDATLVRDLQATLDYKFSLTDCRRRVRDRKELRSALYWASRYASYRARGVRPLLKDPIAVFAAEWIAKVFGAQVVITVRHPAAFANSLRRAGWKYDFHNFLRQPDLMERHLGPFADEIRAAAKRPMDILDQATLLWRAIYHTVSAYQLAHPTWYVVRHEDLSLNPEAEFRRMFAYIDLPFSSRVRKAIADSTSGHAQGIRQLDSFKNVSSWQRGLSKLEIDRIRDQVDHVSSAFYSDADWERSGS